jgi:hypothetical protein
LIADLVRLPLEALPEPVVTGQLGRDDSDRDRATERELGRPLDHAHAAARDESLDLVAADERPAL